MQEMMEGLRTGLLLTVVVILVLLMAYFQSVRLALVVIATVPAVLAGVVIALWATGTTLNIQSMMGAIMAVGVAVANAILLTAFSERERLKGGDILTAAAEGARSRLRPILMTSLAMLVGMLPLALAIGEGGQQSAPLGWAVIGGLSMATLATLLVVPAVFALFSGRAGRQSPSLDPDDPASSHYVQKQTP
jgi:multidrug efflux pump subunit AcrB